MTTTQVRSEDRAAYRATVSASTASTAQPLTDDETIQRALDILSSRMREPGCALTTPETTARYLQLQLAASAWEEFSAIWLDNRHRVISFDKLFRGTINGASVHPREVVRAAIEHNAAAAIFAHNHPSGVAEPSQADIRITQRLKDALALIDVRVLDHFVVGGDSSLAYCSMAERGLI